MLQYNVTLGISLELTSDFIDAANTIHTKADKLTSYLKSEVDNKYDIVNDLIQKRYFTKTHLTYSFALNADLNTQATLITNNTNAIAELNTTLNNKADKSNSYTRAEIISFIETQYTFNGPSKKIVDPVTGKFRIS